MKEAGKKILWCLMPFLSGISFKIYLVSQTWKLPYSWISFPDLVFSLLSSLFLIFFYYAFTNSFQASSKIISLWFDFKIPFISPYIIIIPYIVSIIILPFTNWHGSAFLRTIILGVTVEEILARGIFIKYPDMSQKEFLLWAIISSSFFSLNHWFYDLNYSALSLVDQFQKFGMHFLFGITLAGITFKSKKLTLPIFSHIWSNIQVYMWRYNSTIGIVSYMFFTLLNSLSLIGLNFKLNSKN